MGGFEMSELLHDQPAKRARLSGGDGPSGGAGVSTIPDAEDVLHRLLPLIRPLESLDDYISLKDILPDLNVLSQDSRVAENMRAPEEGTAWGEYAGHVMRLVNKSNVQDAARRLNVGENDFVLEIGPGGHGYSLDVLAPRGGSEKPFKKLVLNEVSGFFRKQCAKYIQKRGLSDVEVCGDDCKDLRSAFPEDHTVDKILAVNVIYFLHPLEEYVKEFSRILRPGSGVGLFALKHVALKKEEDNKSEVFKNCDVEKVVQAFEAGGFKVEVEEVCGSGEMLLNKYFSIQVARPA